ncbi:hypothetical protein [Paracoccus mutanolyticus]|uniref:hypothetical protein n=1 Tax=Paracoccus mutanolyticus TaxID=1499308 RepID=UPI0037CB7806
MQKNIALTGHIVDHLNTVVSQTLWASLSDEDKQIFSEVISRPPNAPARSSRSRGRAGRQVQGLGLTVTDVEQGRFRKDGAGTAAGRILRLQPQGLGRHPRGAVIRRPGAPGRAPGLSPTIWS